MLSRQREFQLYHSDGDAGRVANFFCAKCGTTLLFTPMDTQDVIGVAGGCFVALPLNDPSISASDDLRCSWLRLPESWTIGLAIMAAADGQHVSDTL